MTKPLWVALPLLLAAGLVGALVLRRRLPSRHVLNVWLSLLLMAYLLVTAGLGIFWVAKQQLPVFDWHYLFGYATLLLVALHLGFNFRIVWRHFAARRAAAPPQWPGGGRRGGLAALALVAVAGLSYALGLRQGRREAARAAPPAPGPGSGRAADVVERFHAESAHSRAGLLRSAGVDWGAPPPPFKRLGGAERLGLPAAHSAAPGRLDLAALAALLWHTSGVTLERGGLALRASPSSGALFSTELYVAARAIGGLPSGLWHYDPRSLALERVAAALPAEPWVGGEPAAVIVATAVFRRTGHKYRDRTYRYVLADLGHALENLRVAARVLGAGPHGVAAFDEAQIARDLALDEAEEGVLAVVALQGGGAVPQPLPTAWTPPGGGSASQPRLGVTAEIHRATSLRRRPGEAPPGAVVALDAPVPAPDRVLHLIARRRSTRRFADSPLPRAALQAMLAGLGGPPLLSPAVRIHLVANAVDGLAPGAYRLDAASTFLEPRRAPARLRAAATPLPWTRMSSARLRRSSSCPSTAPSWRPTRSARRAATAMPSWRPAWWASASTSKPPPAAWGCAP